MSRSITSTSSLSPAERIRREQAVAFSRSNNRLEGIELPDEADAIFDRYLIGELDDDGLREALFALARQLAPNPDWQP